MPRNLAYMMPLLQALFRQTTADYLTPLARLFIAAYERYAAGLVSNDPLCAAQLLLNLSGSEGSTEGSSSGLQLWYKTVDNVFQGWGLTDKRPSLAEALGECTDKTCVLWLGLTLSLNKPTLAKRAANRVT